MMCYFAGGSSRLFHHTRQCLFFLNLKSSPVTSIMLYITVLSIFASSAAFTVTRNHHVAPTRHHHHQSVDRALHPFGRGLTRVGMATNSVGLPTPETAIQANEIIDVLVVGAGAAGIGTALMLTKTFGLDTSRVMLVERGEDVGESFRRWPEEMKFISPSFNQQGWTESFDLNAISYGTSPAFSLHTEHPSGKDYAAYLSAIAKTNELQVRRRTEVLSVRPVVSKEVTGEQLFDVDISTNNEDTDAVSQTLSARYIVWAAGEFQYPKGAATKQGKEEEKNNGEQSDASDADSELPGSELCLHNSKVQSWAKLPGDDFIIIGGYESGCDAAVNLAHAGKRCKVLASTPCWDVKTDDPSFELAPYTADRLRRVTAPGFSPQPQLMSPLQVVRVEKAVGGGFNVTATWKALEAEDHAPLREPVSEVKSGQEAGEAGSTVFLHTPNPPILCTGFEGSAKAAASHLFDFADDDDANGCLAGAPLLTDEDESTKVPGVFLVGPSVQHEGLSFCFVYKFRQRFAVVADTICKGLGLDTKAAVDECLDVNMYLKKYDCCADTCGDVC